MTIMYIIILVVVVVAVVAVVVVVLVITAAHFAEACAAPNSKVKGTAALAGDVKTWLE